MNLLFDLDGTLIDSAEGIRWSVMQTFATLSLPLPELQEIPIGPPILITIKKQLGPFAESHFEIARKTYQEIYASSGIQMFSVYDGVPEVLRQLHLKRNRLFIVTGKAQVFAKKIVEVLGWQDVFDGIYGTGLNGEFLDKSDLIEFVINKEGLIPSRTVMIGDRSHDLVAARKNKISAVGVLWGYGNLEELSECSPAHMINDTDKLLELFN